MVWSHGMALSLILPSVVAGTVQGGFGPGESGLIAARQAQRTLIAHAVPEQPVVAAKVLAMSALVVLSVALPTQPGAGWATQPQGREIRMNRIGIFSGREHETGPTRRHAWVAQARPLLPG